MSKLGIILGAGERIRRIRENLGWNQDKLAKYLGVRTSTISRYEGGRIPNEHALAKIANLGNTTTEWILKGGMSEGLITRLRPAPEPDTGQELRFESQRAALPLPGAKGKDSGFSDDLLYDIVVKIEHRLTEKNMVLSPEDKGIIILHLHRLHRDLAVPVTLNTIDAHLALKAMPRRKPE